MVIINLLVTCLQIVNDTDALSEVVKSLSSHLSQVCNCFYSASFIVDERFLCLHSNELVYHGRLLATDGISVEEMRNLTQIWVLEKPVIKVGNHNLQVDSLCSVILSKVGDPYCEVIGLTSSHNNTFPTSAGIFVAVLITIIIIGLMSASILGVYCRRKKGNSPHTSARR